MASPRLDALARSLATRTPRRLAIRSLAGSTLAGTGLLGAARTALARQPRTGLGSGCTADDECHREFSGSICRGEDRDRFCMCPNGAALCEDPDDSSDTFPRCIKLETDAAHCGACNRRCAANQTCREGRCICPDGKQSCGDAGPCCRGNQRCINNRCGNS
jgi:hypothetical protein